MWAGRFDAAPDPTMLAYTRSVEVDSRLWKYDLACSRAHVRAQVASGILPPEDAERLLEGLDEVEAEFERGSFAFLESDEDIHVAIERRLGEICGPVAGKLHAGRSRNDQVVADFRMWVKDACVEAVSALLSLAGALEKKARAAGDAPMPEYTHLQRAQPVPVGHHLAAHAWPLLRDCERFMRAFQSADVCPLGAAAGAGSTLISDTRVAAEALGFRSVFENSVDAISDRDFAADFLFACAVAQVHMSRLAEDIVIWSSEEFGFLELADAWATGSSLMPQKKNPDVAELARGRTAGVISRLTELLVVLKGLPLAYDRDLQEDKKATFEAFDTVVGSAGALAGLTSSSSVRLGRMREALEGTFVLATDLAEELVRRGVPFRQAHEAVGRLVRRLVDEGSTLADVDAADLEAAGVEGLSAEEVRSIGVEKALSARRARGTAGTAPLRSQLDSLKRRIEEVEAWVRARRS